MTNYYRKFIPNLAEVQEPLNRLLRKDAVFIWTEEQQNAFELIKKLVASDRVLAYPDFDKEFRLSTDASLLAAAAVLEQQNDEGDYQPVWFFSRSFNATERRW